MRRRRGQGASASPKLDENIFRACNYHVIFGHFFGQISRKIRDLLTRPSVYGSNGRSYKMLVMFLFFAHRFPSSLDRSP